MDQTPAMMPHIIGFLQREGCQVLMAPIPVVRDMACVTRFTFLKHRAIVYTTDYLSFRFETYYSDDKEPGELEPWTTMGGCKEAFQKLRLVWQEKEAKQARPICAAKPSPPPLVQPYQLPAQTPSTKHERQGLMRLVLIANFLRMKQCTVIENSLVGAGYIVQFSKGEHRGIAVSRNNGRSYVFESLEPIDSVFKRGFASKIPPQKEWYSTDECEERFRELERAWLHSEQATMAWITSFLVSMECVDFTVTDKRIAFARGKHRAMVRSTEDEFWLEIAYSDDNYSTKLIAIFVTKGECSQAFTKLMNAWKEKEDNRAIPFTKVN